MNIIHINNTAQIIKQIILMKKDVSFVFLLFLFDILNPHLSNYIGYFTAPAFQSAVISCYIVYLYPYSNYKTYVLTTF